MVRGWTLEQRSRQAELIHRWRPWEKSSGPKTASGKAKSSQNAFRHGGRSQKTIIKNRELRNLMKMSYGYKPEAADALSRLVEIVCNGCKDLG